MLVKLERGLKMKTLLRVDSSIRRTGSYTRELTEYFENAWKKANPDGHVIRRCLRSDNIPHLTDEALKIFSQPNTSLINKSLSDELISELRKADHVLIGSPLYNLSLPSALKAYFDHVVRSSKTFEVVEGKCLGLLKNKSATLITARSGISSVEQMDDYQVDYLQAILKFIGINKVELVALEATGFDDVQVEKSITFAKQTVDNIFRKYQEPIWKGEFSQSDKHELTELRLKQASAIIEGSVGNYAKLCTNDIQLLIPSRAAVTGIEAFKQAEKAIFEKFQFKSFNKFPLRIERSENLAVEIGEQKVVMHDFENGDGISASNQKYTHVFRKTQNGWRFSVLMSNSNK